MPRSQDNPEEIAALVRVAHDVGTGRWMVLHLVRDARGALNPDRFFGPYDNELAARRQAAGLRRRLAVERATPGERPEMISDA